MISSVTLAVKGIGKPILTTVWSQIRSFSKNRLPTIGAVIILVWLVIAIFAPLIAPSDPLSFVAQPFQPPSWAHLFGTDELGRDVLSRVIYGARISITNSFFVVAFSFLIGVGLGSIAGLAGKVLDMVIMRVVDLVFAFPPIILAMVIAAVLGPGLNHAVLALVSITWPLYARVTRGLILSFRNSEFVQAAWMLGASRKRILFVELIPNVAGPLVVLAMLGFAQAVLLLAALSFLGLGAQPPQPEWGAMVSSGAGYFQQWWLATFPGLSILSVVFAFNLVGDGLRDALDPRVSARV